MTDNWIMDEYEPLQQPTRETEGWLHAFPQTRAWIYRILAALLAIVAGWTGWEAVSTEQWLNLAVSVLNIGGALGFVTADRNVQ